MLNFKTSIIKPEERCLDLKFMKSISGRGHQYQYFPSLYCLLLHIKDSLDVDIGKNKKTSRLQVLSIVFLTFDTIYKC